MNQLIVSITSYPKRFKNLIPVINSLYNQTYKDFHILLTLCKSECENDIELLNDVLNKCKLPVEINWVEKNTYCHKNTFEAILKYPDNPILVLDDDIIRVPTCVEHFVNDYLNYNCIIARNFDYINNNGIIERAQRSIHHKRTTYKSWYFTGIEMPNTGGHGILYPPKYFQDKRFYDADLIMKCSPTSTEVWIYYWLCKEDKLVYFNWDKSWFGRLDLKQTDGCLYMINVVKKRKEYFSNCLKYIEKI